MTKLRINFSLKFIALAFLSFSFFGFSQEAKYEIGEVSLTKETLYDSDSRTFIFFEGAKYNIENSSIPFKEVQIELSSNQEIEQVELSNYSISVVEDEVVSTTILNSEDLDDDFKIEVSYFYFKKRKFAEIKVTPFRVANSGQVEVLKRFDLSYRKKAVAERRNKTATVFKNSSVLSAGEWYKIAVNKESVFKLTYSFFVRNGIDIESIDPRTIKIYGNKAGMLPELNQNNDVDDLEELSILVVGENDGDFSRQDYVLFYGQDPNSKYYDTIADRFIHTQNIYSDSTYYFITFGGALGKRIGNQESLSGTPTNTVSVFDDFQYFEKDRTNFIKSGQEWVGDLFDATTTYQYNFSFPNIDLSSNARLSISAFARSSVPSNLNIQVANSANTLQFFTVNFDRYDTPFAEESKSVYVFQPNSPNLTVTATYSKPQSSSKAWMNFIELNVRRRLVFSGQTMFFRDVNSVIANGLTRFNLSGQLQSAKVWNVSDYRNVLNQEFSLSANTATFVASSNSLQEYVVFNDGDSTVGFSGKVMNQNLHALSNIDYIIVAHPLFKDHAEMLAEFRRNDGLTVEVVLPEQIYNEFGAGSQSPVAIRSLMRMLYEKANSAADLPKYLLLYGDGSYDNKNRISGNTNFIVTYQSKNSTSPVASYVSDDYMAVLDPSEGAYTGADNDKVDLGVGRFPVKNLNESLGVLNKIMLYGTQQSLGDWRNLSVFVADDEDGTLHMNHSAIVSRNIDSVPFMNVEKIYLDAFPQIATPGGDRYPQATIAINSAINKGSLLINYTGHGGETGWTAERVIGVSDINAWQNNKKLPLFITATCEFSRFDDPLRNSGGEMVLLNKDGGGVALMTTTRLVYATPNLYLNDTLYKRMFEKANGEYKYQRLGDIFAITKAQHSNSANAKNFTLLGDPATKLAIPKYNVVTTAINGSPVNGKDTLKALSKVTFTGEVRDENGNLMTNFNGFVYPTIFDKIRSFTTLNNDNNGPYNYKSRNSRLFKGKASVVNGIFSFDFIVPKDISYNVGSGKVSYYADDNQIDASGGSTDFLIGGTADSVELDDQGPNIEMFLNDKNFVYGGITHENPTLILELSDEQGINTVGNGVGHDLVAYIDDKTDESFILNDFYEAALDDYTSGKVTYPMNGLAEGKHRLTVKAWDIHNNSSERTLEFEVLKEKDVKLDHVLNYPNPFTTNTQFWFEHNQAGQTLDVKVDVYTVSGKLVRSISQVIQATGYQSRSIEWDGRDDFGDRIGRGVYVYRLKVSSRNGSVAEKYEKLVIL